MSLATKFRAMRLSKNQRTLREAGVLDSAGVHTKEGRNLLWAILFDKHEQDLVDAVAAQAGDDKETATAKSAKASK